MMRRRSPWLAMAATALTMSCGSGTPLEPPLPPEVATLAVVPGRVFVSLGGITRLTVDARNDAGLPVPIDPAQVDWVSREPAVATVSAGGVVTGVGLGDVTIEASLFGRTLPARVTVLLPVPAPTAWSTESAAISNASLLGVWAGENLSVAVGSDGTILHGSAGIWEQVESPTSVILTAVWGAADDDIWAVGDSGTVLHFDGLAWSGVPVPSANTLLGIWGLGPDQVWATGVNVVLAWDGVTWQSMPLPPGPHELWGIWGTDPSNLHAVGQSGDLLRFDGTAWSVLPSPTPLGLFGVHGIHAGEVWAVGVNGTLLRFDGTTWTLAPSPTPANLFAVTGDGPGQLAAVGNRGVVLRFTGTTWTLVPQDATVDNLRAAHTDVSGNLVIAGWSAAIARRRGGSAWESELQGNDLFTATVRGSGEWFAAGVAGMVLTRDASGGRWTRLPAPTTEAIFGLAAGPGNELIAVGDSSTLLRFDGAVWSPIPPVTSIPTLWRSVWIDPGGDAVIVGEGGRIMQRRNGSWETVPSPTTIFLRHVFGLGPDRIWAVGDDGIILRYDGTIWTEMISPVTTRLRGIWGTAEDDLFAVGEEGVILRFDGTRWFRMPSPVELELRAVTGTGPTDVVAVGEEGVILRFDGGTWVVSARTIDGFLLGALSDGEEVRAVGQGLSILRADRGASGAQGLRTRSVPRPRGGVRYSPR